MKKAKGLFQKVLATTLTLLLVNGVMLPAVSTYASDISQPVVDSLFFSEIEISHFIDEATLYFIIDASLNKSIDLERTYITLFDDGAIMFFTPHLFTSHEDEGDLPLAYYGLYAEPYNELSRTQSVPTTVSPQGNPRGTSWTFSASAAGAHTFMTNHYVTGRSSYNINVNNNGTGELSVNVRRRPTSFIGLAANLNRFNVPARGTARITNISARSDYRVYVRFDRSSNSGNMNFNGTISG